MNSPLSKQACAVEDLDLQNSLMTLSIIKLRDMMMLFNMPLKALCDWSTMCPGAPRVAASGNAHNSFEGIQLMTRILLPSNFRTPDIIYCDSRIRRDQREEGKHPEGRRPEESPSIAKFIDSPNPTRLAYPDTADSRAYLQHVPLAAFTRILESARN
ncbi:uncharacterized protein BCR38DRAFT_413951 [Pseudomassariella vexata]|uniref:Uncharacterized protein n=1 Tax=Pseudomassariella vexata TaxID=1141098 RepID=A0A1Y2DE72_9PEZI|nr:uncharacterized protein BCR38DRAFT_413951 [Pseudomassariella vexata]ORY57568.1 hypothetical protein BCR38DRAFT_413951 [Pseudomassariella vexata]